MLTEEERVAFEQSIAQVKKLASSMIAKNTTPQQSIQFISTLHQGVDQVASKTASLQPPIECKVGCAHCCENRRVEVTVPEAFYIADKLKALPKAELNFLITQLEQYIKNQALDKPQPCTFLNNQQCSIYAIRPAVCRKGHSLSANACANGSSEIPQHLEVVVEIDALLAGTSEAYKENRLQTESMELNAAILRALTDASWLDTWHQEKGDC